MKELLKSARELDVYLRRIRREIHRNPEVSGEERETAALVVRELTACGCYEIREHVAGYGVIADLAGSTPGPVTALRADMDALPVAEETGLSFASEKPGKMHACGHDLHTAMLLGAAKLLAERKDEISGTVRLLFQPAEEDPALDGAVGMIRAGALDGVSALFGMHIWPELPAGTFGIRPGEMMAASDHFSVEIKGRGAHGATPHMGHDALLAGCQFVQAVQNIISRDIDPFEPAVITIGEFASGVKYNVLAGTCRLEGTIRSYSAGVRQKIKMRLEDVLSGICCAAGCRGELSYVSGHPAVMNDPLLAGDCLTIAEEIFGTDNTIRLERPTTISEDFSRYTEVVPAAFGFVGATHPGDRVWPLHSCYLSPDEDIMVYGAAMHCAFALTHCSGRQ